LKMLSWDPAASRLQAVSDRDAAEGRARRELSLEEAVAAALEPALVEDMADIAIEELRERRRLCNELEVEVSYLRRLAQGRMDILQAELERREAGGDHPELVARLAEALGDRIVTGGSGRLALLMAPDLEDPALTSELDRVVDPAIIARAGELSPEEIGAALAALGEYERHISELRRMLHDRIDAYQAELVRRYREDLARVDDLLN